MLPFDPLGPLGLFARNVAAAGEIDAVALELAAAVEVHRAVGIDGPGHLLGLAEGARRVGAGAGGKQQDEQEKAEAAHGNLDD